MVQPKAGVAEVSKVANPKKTSEVAPPDLPLPKKAEEAGSWNDDAYTDYTTSSEEDPNDGEPAAADSKATSTDHKDGKVMGTPKQTMRVKVLVDKREKFRAEVLGLSLIHI